jgi:hypothetical protein
MNPMVVVMTETPPDLAVPFGMSIGAAIFYTDYFDDTPLGGLEPDTVASIAHRFSISTTRPRKLTLPVDFGVSDELYHESTELVPMIPANVCNSCVTLFAWMVLICILVSFAF